MPLLARLCLALAVLGTAAPALAKGYARLGTMYNSTESGVEGSTGKSSKMNLELGAGWVGSSGWSLGALYAQETQSSAGQDTLSQSGTGLTGGWIAGDDGFYGLLTYFLSLSRGSEKGTGLQVDLGYKFKAGKMSFAPQLSYRDFKFGNSSPKSISKTVSPLFVFWVDF
ncbi:MAG: hypothetical protein KF802_14575 [Bdellovibrionaceae bacterium]|nr:hypothetical protein [Pseudobdellovibrionaceae bacterium]